MAVVDPNATTSFFTVPFIYLLLPQYILCTLIFLHPTLSGPKENDENKRNTYVPMLLDYRDSIFYTALKRAGIITCWSYGSFL